MRELVNLKDNQESIRKLCEWCLRNKKSAYKIARCWLKVVKKVRPEAKLNLLYLVNDVVQHSKKKGDKEMVAKIKGVLKEAMPHLRDGKICEKVQRVLNIWREREVFVEGFIDELAKSVDPSNDEDPDEQEEREIIENFQVRFCVSL